jgi:hypothetical protein
MNLPPEVAHHISRWRLWLCEIHQVAAEYDFNRPLKSDVLSF